jgi:hypothetical protein
MSTGICFVACANSRSSGVSSGSLCLSNLITLRIVFKALNLSSVCRIDFLIDKKANKFYVNEPNTIPGSLSFYLWKEDGLSYKELLNEMINACIKEYKNRSRKTRSFESNILENFNGSKGCKGGLKK